MSTPEAFHPADAPDTPDAPGALGPSDATAPSVAADPSDAAGTSTAARRAPEPAPVTPFRRWATRAGWVLAVVVPLWLAGGRFLTDSAGSLTPVYAATLTPLMLVLSLVALGIPARRAARYPSVRACVILSISWACGIALGFTLPDTGPGASSMIGAWSGPGAEGAAAALSNPLGIIMLFTAVMGCVVAIRHSGHGDGSGAPRDTDEDEAQGTGHFPLLEV